MVAVLNVECKIRINNYRPGLPVALVMFIVQKKKRYGEK